MTANPTSTWNLRWKCTLMNILAKEDFFFKVLLMKVFHEISFQQTVKAKLWKNAGISPWIFFSTLNQQTENFDHDSKVWTFWVKGHFIKHCYQVDFYVCWLYEHLSLLYLFSYGYFILLLQFILHERVLGWNGIHYHPMSLATRTCLCRYHCRVTLVGYIN